MPLSSPCECAFLVAEKLGGDKGWRDRGEIHSNERAVGTVGSFMNGARYQFLAGSALSGDENRGIRRSHSRQMSQNTIERFGGANDFLEHGRRRDIFTQREVLVVKTVTGTLIVAELLTEDVIDR